MKSDYTIRELTAEEFIPHFEEHRAKVFEDIHNYRTDQLFSEAEHEEISLLNTRMGDPFKLHLGAFDKDDNFVGWSWGIQESRWSYYMVNSGVLVDYQRKGIYTALLEKALKRVTEEGFQLIYSRHCATNNSVIIPKLKAGFVISKMEISDQFGVLVHLHYYKNKVRREIMDYRSGQMKPNQKIKELFDI